uniref:AGC-kinase C-terminal domain-containing protein n=1 Tax=Mesocestoides corti TaxID=53468 RepID=A0A5K3G0S1_MESCO
MYGAYQREFLQKAVLGRAVSPLREAMLQPNDIMHPDELFFPTLTYNDFGDIGYPRLF